MQKLLHHLFLCDLCIWLASIPVPWTLLDPLVFNKSSDVLLDMLIIWVTTLPKSFASFELYQKILANDVSLNGHVDHQIPKSKLNGPNKGSIFLT